jgi:nucleoside-diphosphate-sugar epimerase
MVSEGPPPATIWARAAALISSIVAERSRSRRVDAMAAWSRQTDPIANAIRNVNAVRICSGQNMNTVHSYEEGTTTMNDLKPLHVVLGAGGGAGSAIVKALVDAGHRVRAVARSAAADLAERVEWRSTNITSPDGIDRALDGAAVAYMAAQPPYHRWPQEFPAMLDQVIAGCARSGTKLVMVDNLYCYGPGHDVLTAATAHSATDSKGVVRRHMLAAVLAAHQSGKIRAAVGQASDYFGPGAANSALSALAIAPTRGTGKVRWMGSLDQPHSVAYLPDIARAYVTLGTSDAADGSVWILPHGPAVTGRRFLEIVNEQLDTPRRFSVISGNVLRLAAPFHRISRESLGVLYQWTGPWIADDTVFQSAFGPFAPTPLDLAIKSTVDHQEQ